VPGLLVALFMVGTAQAQGAEEKSRVDALKNHLTTKGFVWQEGQVWFPPILDMCCQCKLPSCYSNNASSQYGFFVLPPARGQDPLVKNPYAEWFTEDSSLPPSWSYAWRLRPDEAVVFIGKTPPRVEYFGFTAYLYDRYVATLGPMPDCTWNKGETIEHRAQPASVQNRFPVFASLGDTINNETIRLEGGRQNTFPVFSSLGDTINDETIRRENVPQNSFDKNVVVVAAADRNVLRKVEDSLEEAGYPEKSINFLPLTPALTRLGLDSRDDSLMILLRVSPGSDNTADDYSAQPKTLLRVTPSTSIPVSQLAPVVPPKLRVRGTGKTEAFLEAQIDELGQAIVAYYASLGYTAASVKMATLPDGFNCISNMQNCLADNRDTIYISPAYDIISGQLLPGQPSLILGPNEFLVAYGVQHPAVHKALYSNISIMGWFKRAAPAVVTNQDMAGSAQEYLPGADPALYAYQIARTNGCRLRLSQHCVALDTGCGNGIAADEPVAPVFRAYLEPGTKIGPSRGEVVLDRVLKFRPAQ
jgi:hypothetical protein